MLGKFLSTLGGTHMTPSDNVSFPIHDIHSLSADNTHITLLD